MGDLTNYLKDKAARLHAAAPERKKLIEDWLSALNRLLTVIEQWTREADTERILAIRRTEHTLNEEKMGVYAAPGLEITLTLDGQQVGVVPVARRVGGSVNPPGEEKSLPVDGRVDLRRYGDTMYTLYRVKEGDRDRWFVVHSGAWDMRRKQPITQPLTREEFEADLASLFE